MRLSERRGGREEGEEACVRDTRELCRTNYQGRHRFYARACPYLSLNLTHARRTFLLVPARRTLLSTARNMMNDDDGGSAALSLYGQRLLVFRDSGSRTTATTQLGHGGLSSVSRETATPNDTNSTTAYVV